MVYSPEFSEEFSEEFDRPTPVGAWLKMDSRARWKGMWDSGTLYIEGDVVLYQDGNLIHAFISKTDHNVGNIPKSSYANWTRAIQENWKA